MKDDLGFQDEVKRSTTCLSTLALSHFRIVKEL